MNTYKLAARWHAYRLRTDGVPVPPTTWTGPEPDNRLRYTKVHQVPDTIALAVAAPTTLADWAKRANDGADMARSNGGCAYFTGLCACHGGPGCLAAARTPAGASC